MRMIQYKKSRPVPVSAPGGLVYYVLPWDERAREQIAGGFHKDLSMRVFEAAGRTADMVVGVGSNYGEFIFPLVLKRKSDNDFDSVVYWSFEPNPRLYQCLLKTREVNQLPTDKIRVWDVALGARSDKFL